MSAPAVEVTDITNSPAYLVLEDALTKGVLTQAQVDMFKSKYAKLHEVVLKTFENEKSLLRTARELKQDLIDRRKELESLEKGNDDEDDSVENLREEIMKAEREQTLCNEREALVDMELQEVQRQHLELQAEVEELQSEEDPRIKDNEQLIEQLKDEKVKAADEIMKLKHELEEGEDKSTQLTKNLEEQQEEKMRQFEHLVSIKNDPDKLKKQADMVAQAKETFQRQADQLQETLQGLEDDVNEAHERTKDKEEIHLEMEVIVEKHKQAIEQKARQTEEVKRNLDLNKDQNNTLLSERVKADMESRRWTMDEKRESEVLNRSVRSKESAMREVKKAEHQLKVAEQGKPLLEYQREQLKRKKQKQLVEREEQQEALEELTRDVDIYINNYLKQEIVEKDKAEGLEALLGEIKGLDNDVKVRRAEERKNAAVIADLSAQREHKAREAAKALNNARETYEELKVKEVIIMDLTKKMSDASARLKEFSGLYDVVKTERNKYVNMIQSSQQAKSEMREKIKVLENEIEILRNESSQKEKTLQKARQDHQSAFYARDTLRVDQNKAQKNYREKQEQMDLQIVEIDKLNSIINSAEREMLKLKKQYEKAVEDRNYSGIQLIDRNDELCILYEKSNIQENILKKGEIEIRKREEEIRLLNLKLREIQREMELQEKKAPDGFKWEAMVKELRQELAEEQTKTADLSAKLENPDHEDAPNRWRALEGSDPPPEELVAQITSLEQRLNNRKEHLLEKELVLEEVTTLSDRLRKKATEGREDTLDLAKQVNEYQARIKSVTRKMMATVAELSMYQATAMKLKEEKDGLEGHVKEAHERFDAGEAPTADAEQEWYRMERDRLRREEEAMMRDVEGGFVDAGPEITRTTAEPRPNAYIPDEIGIPKPYGGLAPFKPSESGSTMRFIRKPQPQEIEI